MISAWESFTLSVDESLESYNRHPEGRRYPARASHKDDTHIVIDCPHGQSDPFGTFLITISASMHKHELTIDCCIAEWKCHLRAGPTKLPCTNMRFVLSDDDVSLDCDRKKFTPFKAAEHLLFRALLKDQS